MTLSILISALTCLLMILGVLLVPYVRLWRFKIYSYWVVAALGALTLMLLGQAEWGRVARALIADTAINPLKILVLFISMTILSIFLDELGFFSFLAARMLRHAGNSQLRLFLYLYLMVSVLTVFTSNDIIILSFTPFICYFAKNARIDPIPYLAAEFVAANTWSMALVIGNPTNIYLATAGGVQFVEYLQVMLLPTLASGAVAFFLLWLLFWRKLSQPVQPQAVEEHIEDKLDLTVGLVHLAVCTVLLAVSSYIGLEMWYVAAAAAGSLFLCVGLISTVRPSALKVLGRCARRAPWQLVPFVVSMFVISIVLTDQGVTAAIGRFLGSEATLWRYGFSSFIAANLVNNIPMSVLMSSVMEGTAPLVHLKALYATVAGSNVGAFLTPIGALAGIMWSSILRRHQLRFGYLDFLRMGVSVAIPTLCTALLVLEVLL